MNVGLEICGMFILTAGELGLDSVDLLAPYASEVNEAALESDARVLFEAISTNLERGRPPTEVNIRDVAGAGVTGRVLGDAKSAAKDAQGHAKLEAAIASLNANYLKEQNHKWLTAALEANRKGQLGDLRDSVSKLDLLDPSGTPESRSRYESFTSAPVLDRPIRLSHQRLSYALRGGLGTGKLLSMSLWVAPTGMGKSTFWYGEIPQICQQGHWVLYFAAEADDADIYTEVTRLHAGLPLDALENMDQVPVRAEKFNRARDSLKDFMGRTFSVWSGPFDCDTVRQEAERVLREMKEAGATGKLVVIVDNYDALYELASSESKTAAMAINDEIHRLSRHAGENDYHIAMLAQSIADDEQKKGPASGQVYGNRKIGQKFGTVVVLYRPRKDDDADLKPCVAIRKARQMRNVSPVIEMSPNDHVGLWTEANPLPF